MAKSAAKKPKKQTVKKPAKARPAGSLRTQINNIAAAEAHANQCHLDVLVAEDTLRQSKELLKGRKAAHTAALNDLCSEIRGDPSRPLFNVMEGRTAKEPPPKKPAAANPGPATAPAGPSATDEAWKAVPTSSLGLPKSLVEKLAEFKHRSVPEGINSLGEYVAYQATGEWITNIPGVGKAAVDKLDNAVDKYFTAHPIARIDSEEKEAIET